MRELLPVVLLLAACGSDAAVEKTVSVEPPSTTVVEATTTTETAVPLDLCRGGRAILWEPGQTYVVDCFLVPVSFGPVDPGWRTSRVENDRFHITFAEAGAPIAELAVLAYRSSSGRDGVVDSILALEALTVVAERSEVTVGGRPAVTLDVETAPDPSREPFWDECHSSSLGTVIAVPDGPGWRLLEGGLDGTDDYGFSPCRTFRLWVVDVADQAITLIAASQQEQTLYESMPTIERLVESIVFEPR